MKQYKHKFSDFILRTNNDTNTLDMYDCKDRMICKGVPQSMVILGNDWEEIKEEDWIDLVIRDIFGIDMPSELGGDNLRSSITTYLPLITDDMIEKMVIGLYDNSLDDELSKIKYIKQNLPKDLLANPE